MRLKYMYDNIELGPKLFDCHEIACDQVTENITKYLEIINGPKILEDTDNIKTQYDELLEIVKEIKREFFEKFTENLELKIGLKKSSRESKQVVKNQDLEKLKTDLEEISGKLLILENQEKEAKKREQQAEAERSSKFKESKKGLKGLIEKAFKSVQTEVKNFLKSIKKNKETFMKQQQILIEKIKMHATKEASKVRVKDNTNAILFKDYVTKQFKTIFKGGGRKTMYNRKKHKQKYTKKNKKNKNKKKTYKHKITKIKKTKRSKKI